MLVNSFSSQVIINWSKQTKNGYLLKEQTPSEK